MKISIICGGPSLERGISLNSARSVLDHLQSEEVEVVPFYLNSRKRAYRISPAQLYSNTPSDFDFKLAHAAHALSEKRFVKALKETDLVFPVMHGPYGEDGGVQRFLEKHGLPFVGSASEACVKAFDKFKANEYIKNHGFFILPSVVLKIYQSDHKKILEKFFKEYHIKRAIVKPATGGSSVGVFSVSSVAEALEKTNFLFSKRMDTRVVVEPFAEGAEFTMIILENRFGLPVALPPTEIETDYTENQIFDFRRKYLPTRQVTWHCPPRFADDVIERIQAQAEQLFALFGMRDFARFDGWVLPSGEIWFCDFNTISGMEQNSFLFQQASRVGMTHADVLRYIVESAARRECITMPSVRTARVRKRKPVSVIFGGPTSERQVSLMSGTNVWLKLRGSKIYEPHPYLLDIDGSVWRIPYHLALNHTVEEIADNCMQYARAKKRLEAFEKRARLRLGIMGEKDTREFFDPEHMTLAQCIERTSFMFLALHGGAGEDGTLQMFLEKKCIPYNGPDSRASRLTIDKWATAEYIEKLGMKDVERTPGLLVASATLVAIPERDIGTYWRRLRAELRSDTIIIKPRGDGCSSGIVRLFTASDLTRYLALVRSRAHFAPQSTFRNQRDPIEMPSDMPSHFIFEKFMETDTLRVKNNILRHARRSGLVEITIGVVERKGKLHALNPSITVVEGEVLSVEEKFQGGTGVNLTPPPPQIMKPTIVKKVRTRIEELAKKIGITGYSRIDAFVDIKTGKLFIIEINSLPGLTPSTVLYQQALAEDPPIFPRELLETLIKNKGY